jgi:hypothetical protein
MEYGMSGQEDFLVSSVGLNGATNPDAGNVCPTYIDPAEGRRGRREQ